MSEKTDFEYNFSSIELFNFIIKKIKPIAIITIIGAIVSVIVALSIKPRYKSKVVMFPATSSSISYDLLANNPGQKNILKFGSEEEVEQMIQVLFSDEIRNKVISKFNLMKHYDIDSTSQFPLTNLYKMYNDNITYRRTEYMSVEIEVLDVDPQIAANIANTISQLVDTVMNRMQKQRALLALKLVEKEYTDLVAEVHLMEDSLKMIRSKGINNYETQAEVFNSEYAVALSKGNQTGIKLLQQKLDTLSKYGGAYVSLRDKIIYETERMSHLKAKYLEAKVDYEQKLPHTFIVDTAVKAEKKSKPVRWLIVSVSTASTAIFALLILIIIDSLGNNFSFLQRVKREKS